MWCVVCCIGLSRRLSRFDLIVEFRNIGVVVDVGPTCPATWKIGVPPVVTTERAWMRFAETGSLLL